MGLTRSQISFMDPVLEWAKRAALYPKDLQGLEWVVEQMGHTSRSKPEPYPEIEDLRQEWGKSPGTFLEAQQVEYTRLFVNRFGGVLAPPYASYYLDHKTLFGPSTSSVVALYRQGGLAWSKVEGAETPDHLAVELEFVQFLSRKISVEQDESEDCYAEDLWHQFWEKHLNHWLPAFVGRISEHTRTPLYQLLARTLKEIYEKESGHGRPIRHDL